MGMGFALLLHQSFLSVSSSLLALQTKITIQLQAGTELQAQSSRHFKDHLCALLLAKRRNQAAWKVVGHQAHSRFCARGHLLHRVRMQCCASTKSALRKALSSKAGSMNEGASLLLAEYVCDAARVSNSLSTSTEDEFRSPCTGARPASLPLLPGDFPSARAAESSLFSLLASSSRARACFVPKSNQTSGDIIFQL